MRAVRSALVLAALLTGLVTALPAQELSLSLGAGGFFPSASVNRRIFGSGPSFSADVSLKIKAGLGVSAGLGLTADKGKAIPGTGGLDAFPLELRRFSVPLVLFYQLDAGPAAVRLGAGLGYHSYRETWPTVPVEFRGHKVATRMALAVLLKVTGRISLLGSACYESIPTGAGTSLDPNVNLGGFQVIGGLLFRLYSR